LARQEAQGAPEAWTRPKGSRSEPTP
jgi:hypothetical protein